VRPRLTDSIVSDTLVNLSSVLLRVHCDVKVVFSFDFFDGTKGFYDSCKHFLFYFTKFALQN
jgi:hypothetical protein